MGQFKADQPIDTFRYYYSDGNLKSLMIFDENDPKRQHAVHFYSTGDTLAKGDYLKQEKDGMWSAYGENSQLVRKTYYMKGKKNGAEVTVYPNGQPAKVVNYKDDIENGPYQTFYEDGQLKQDAFYLNGARHGQITFYQADGKKDQEGEYVEGQRDGKWLIYDEHELVVTLLKYENGVLLNPEDAPEGDYNKEEFRNQRKDRLEFDDLRGGIRYE
jgi:antitoxin component YwqK of YwqJK toxin-antitoxin module